jgi:hypothetical protein
MEIPPGQSGLPVDWSLVCNGMKTMSWKTLNQILGLAGIDEGFWQDLQKDPVAAIEARGFALHPDERAFLSRTIVTDLADFSRVLQDRFGSSQQSDIS